MDKLTRYNQRLLAITGTMVLATVGILILTGGIVLAVELTREYSHSQQTDNDITLAKEAKKGDSTIIRDQEITFQSPQLIDTVQAIYLIPVSQVNLKNPEEIDSDNFQQLLDLGSSGSRKFRYGYRYTGTYNNLIVYRQQQASLEAVFNKKTSISSYQNVTIHAHQYLLIEGNTADTNGDKKLSADDLKSFFVYDLATKELKVFSVKSMGLVDFYVTHGSDEIILRFAKDKDLNGEINKYEEPVYLKKLSLSSFVMTDLIDQQTLTNLQRLIDE
ncbi:MAG: hypothetical protein OEY56_11955 [Cyclobacteriaceae bacterium]|nr:hypothetical protein [Cyclobacteriaceae bacterium]